MIAKILSLTALLVAIIFAQPPPRRCDDEDACFVAVDPNPPANEPCSFQQLNCSALPIPQCKTPSVGCDITTGCIYNNVTNYPFVSCNDSNACTFDDTCIDGICEGIPIMCDDVCMTNGFCDNTTGQCVYEGAVECPPIVCQTGVCVNPDGCRYSHDNTLTCNNSIPCMNDACVDGQCISTPVICNQTCMTGSCNPNTGGCVFLPVQCPAIPCMTGVCNPTTGNCTYTSVTCPQRPCMNGVCNSTTGQCTYTPITCSQVPCMNGTCNTTTGQCTYTSKNCSDNNPCTMDSCVSGNCVHTMINCTRVSSSNPCQFNNGTCNPSTGQCIYAMKSNGTICDDGNVCTTKDKCLSGQCTGTNTCCMDRYKSKCGICVSDCCSGYAKVLSFFGLHGGESDVTEVSGSCSSSTVCCAPKTQSIFTYPNDRCVVRKPY
jgi:hypothetical protein